MWRLLCRLASQSAFADCQACCVESRLRRLAGPGVRHGTSRGGGHPEVPANLVAFRAQVLKHGSPVGANLQADFWLEGVNVRPVRLKPGGS